MHHFLSFPTGSSGLRRAAAGAAALLLACGPLVACSQDPGGGASGVPAYDPEAAASARASESAAAAQASASAAASAEAAGVVTAESLSTERHVITSIPEDLDELQTEVLRAFVHYDQVTWNIWFTRTGIEDAQPLMTAEAYQRLTNNVDQAVAGHTDGTVRVAVTSVYLTSLDAVRPEAVVEVCADQTDLVKYDAEGNDISNPDTLQVRRNIRVTMVYEDGTWKEASEGTLSINECTV
ncbi:hypothetical protein [Actinomyces sp. 565]|uniref:hypothetical protein n=1 Tax=Actinomyces sp. 565 TaxID=2057794 RepID=UPI0013A6905C|nr:hypothetical protein [Actinomyces sp. 565]NDR53114.1 hypothetical protein [Actinomyces sp. 565]